jgi:hypothetical protein
VSGHLATLVMRHGLEQRWRHTGQLSRHRLKRSICPRRIELGQHHEPAGALHPVATAKQVFAPRIRSLSQCHGAWWPSTSSGRLRIFCSAG